jgi:hypothetical protein
MQRDRGHGRAKKQSQKPLCHPGTVGGRVLSCKAQMEKTKEHAVEKEEGKRKVKNTQLA